MEREDMTRLSRLSASRSKYGNIKVPFAGEVFDSKLELNVWLQLKAREQNGEISDLRRQVPFELQPKFKDDFGVNHRDISYTPDFLFVEDSRTIAVDAKGFFTKDARIKAKLFQYRYPGIELRIITAL